MPKLSRDLTALPPGEMLGFWAEAGLPLVLLGVLSLEELWDLGGVPSLVAPGQVQQVKAATSATSSPC